MKKEDCIKKIVFIANEFKFGGIRQVEFEQAVTHYLEECIEIPLDDLLGKAPPKADVLLAEYAHDAWAGWMFYLFEKSELNNNGTMTIPKWAVDRWKRQAETKYKDLPIEEQKNDLDEANKILKILASKTA